MSHTKSFCLLLSGAVYSVVCYISTYNFKQASSPIRLPVILSHQPFIIHLRKSIKMASSGKLIKPSSTSPKSFYQTPSPYEQRIGYYRGVRHGNQIFISGTTAVDPNSPPVAPQILHPGDAAAQMRVALGECIRVVDELLSGSTGQGRGQGRAERSIVRVRMFVSRKEDAPGVMEAFREMLGAGREGRGAEEDEVGAAATLLVVKDGFVSDDMLVEVEVDAIASD